MTSRTSWSRAPCTRHRLLGGKVAAAVWDTSRQAKTSRRKARANAHPPRKRCRSARFTPTAATSIVMSMSETRRSRGNPSVPETRSRRPHQNSPGSVLPDFTTFVGIWRKSYKASARCTSMGDESTCTTENCKTLRMTRSSLYTSPIVFVRGKGSSLISRERWFSARSEKLLAVNTFERANSVDIFHDDCGHPNLAVVLFRDGFDGTTRDKEILRNPIFDFISVHQIPVFIVQMFESTSVRGPITCFATREGGTSYK